MLTTDRVSGLVLVGVAAAAAAGTRGLPVGSLGEPGPGFLPLVLAGLLALFGLIVAFADRRSGALRALEWPEARHAVAILAACAFAALALERLGYRATVFVLVAVLAGVVERRRPLAALAVAAGLAAVTYYVFATLLKVPLPRGPFGL
ncbi:MAG TPA: tripartite tricarboxylate transporter TctB family protein [Thermodesulfobacteriota bacterium]